MWVFVRQSLFPWTCGNQGWFRKVDVGSYWRRPSTMIEIQSFLGLVGYYREFIKEFSKIALHLTMLTQKGVKFE